MTLAALAVFGALLAAEIAGPLTVDEHAHWWATTHRTPAVTTAAIAITNAGSSAVVLPLVCVAVFIATSAPATRRAQCAATCSAVVGIGIAARYAVAGIVARPRPPHQDWAYHAAGFAFPSGHSTDAALAAGTIGWVLARRMRRHPGRLRLAVSVLVAAYPAAVGASRVYLGMHWPTDVLAGWVFAAFWLGTALIVTGSIRASLRHDRGG